MSRWLRDNPHPVSLPAPLAQLLPVAPVSLPGPVARSLPVAPLNLPLPRQGLPSTAFPPSLPPPSASLPATPPVLVPISSRRSPCLHPITNSIALVRSAGASLPVRTFQSSRAFPVFRAASTPQPLPLVRRCPPSNSFRVPSAPKTFLARSLVGSSAPSSLFTSFLSRVSLPVFRLSTCYLPSRPSSFRCPVHTHVVPLHGSYYHSGFRGDPCAQPRRAWSPPQFSLCAGWAPQDQWRRGNGDELIKLVETTRTLTPVHFATSSPTYLNNVVKE